MVHYVYVILETAYIHLLLENVPTLLSERHLPNFNIWIKQLKDLGYVRKYVRVNARHYGIPQNRERVFTVSIIDKQTENSEFLSVNVKNYEIPGVLIATVISLFLLSAL